PGKRFAIGSLPTIARPRKKRSMFTKCVIMSGMPLVLVLVLLAQAEDVRERMAAVLRYTGVENPAPSDVARMAELWTKVQQPGLSADERRTTLRDMVLVLPAARARPRGPPSGA